MQLSVHPPNKFLQTHATELLPHWSQPIASVLVVLQQCECPLWERTPATETDKNRLRDRFLQLAQPLVSQLQQKGYLATAFDPRTGWPFGSAAGSLALDHVAVIKSTLHYPTSHSGGCQVLLHPIWQSAVYPAILLTSAPPQHLQALISAQTVS